MSFWDRFKRPPRYAIDSVEVAVRNIKNALYLSLGVPEKQWRELDAALAKQAVGSTPAEVIQQVMDAKRSVG